MKKILMLIVILLFSISVLKAEEEKRKVLNIVIPVTKTRKKDVKFIEKFRKYLEKKLDVELRIDAVDGYIKAVERLEKSSADLAVLTPIVYASIMNEKNIKYLGTMVYNNKSFYRSVCIANKKSNIETVKDLKNVKVGFGDRYSASGYIFPRYFLKTKGLINNKKDLFNSIMLKNHSKIIKALKNEEVDAAFTYDLNTQDLTGKFRLVYVCPIKIPHAAIVVNSRTLKSKMIKKIQKYSYQFNNSEKGVMQRLKNDKNLYNRLIEFIN